uniref:WD repeat-containing protein 79 n=1 Tax=Gongylonema pulchrum TaxID=637853 RepID=A0A183EHM9_9BILA
LFECRHAITSLCYTPDGTFLLTAGRKDDDIICWDLRSPGKIYSLYRRPSQTNQKIHFDMDSSGHYLFSGSTTGDLYIFDLKSTNGPEQPTPAVVKVSQAHRAALCGVSVNKERAVVATCSGQRVFPFPELDDVEVVDENGTYEDTNSPEFYDNSLALWDLQV